MQLDPDNRLVADELEFDTLLDRHTEAQLAVLLNERSHEAA
jgi:hypothetical protein